MKGIPGIAWDVPRVLWDPGDALGTPLVTRGRPWDARARPRPAEDVPETHRGRSWDPWEPPGTPYGPQKQSYLSKYTAQEALDCYVRTCLLGPIA